MREDYMEKLETMFPGGFVLIYNLEKQVRYHVFDPLCEIKISDIYKCAEILEQKTEE